MRIQTALPRTDKAYRPTPGPQSAFSMLFLIDRLIEMGGAELALVRLVRDLPAKGILPIVIAFQQDVDAEFRELFSCPLFCMPLTRTYGFAAFRTARRLRSIIRRYNIKLVHTIFETSDLYGGLVTKTLPHVTLISSRRDLGILRALKHRVAYRVLNWMPDRVVAVSNRVRDWCIHQDGISDSRVVTVYNGVEETPHRTQWRLERAKTRTSLGIDSKIIAITAVGHIRRVKGYDLLIHAAKKVIKHYPHTVFFIAGDDHEPGTLDHLKEMVLSSSLQNTIRFLGSVRDTESLLQSSDIFVLPSRSEGFSNALIEAMMSGLPCVVTDVGGNAEAVSHGESGYTVLTEDADALANALLLLLASKQLRITMGEAGLQRARTQFTQKRMVDNMVTVYRDALKVRSF
jgi:glycosyltransferase involved in cell wall biosynthesis